MNKLDFIEFENFLLFPIEGNNKNILLGYHIKGDGMDVIQYFSEKLQEKLCGDCDNSDKRKILDKYSKLNNNDEYEVVKVLYKDKEYYIVSGYSNKFNKYLTPSEYYQFLTTQEFSPTTDRESLSPDAFSRKQLCDFIGYENEDKFDSIISFLEDKYKDQ